jgi:hypothetical protein
MPSQLLIWARVSSTGIQTVTNSLILQAGSTNLREVSKLTGSPANDQVVTTNVTHGVVI